jgi:hypothetical protein
MTTTKQKFPTFTEWLVFEQNQPEEDRIDLGDKYNAQLIYLMIRDYVANNFEV